MPAGHVLVQLRGTQALLGTKSESCVSKEAAVLGHYPGITVMTKQERLKPDPIQQKDRVSVTSLPLSPCFLLSARGAVQPGVY